MPPEEFVTDVVILASSEHSPHCSDNCIRNDLLKPQGSEKSHVVNSCIIGCFVFDGSGFPNQAHYKVEHCLNLSLLKTSSSDRAAILLDRSLYYASVCRTGLAIMSHTNATAWPDLEQFSVALLSQQWRCTL